MELDQSDEQQAEEDGRAGEGENETFGKSKIFSYQTPGLEILQCKYRVAVTEVVELKAEVKALKDRLAQHAERAEDDKPSPNNQLEMLRRQLSSSEQSCQEGEQKVSTIMRTLARHSGRASRIQSMSSLLSQITSLESELQKALAISGESQGALNAAQEELVMLSEELAQLYHHICLCNNETPNWVMLDYYRSVEDSSTQRCFLYTQ